MHQPWHHSHQHDAAAAVAAQDLVQEWGQNFVAWLVKEVERQQQLVGAELTAGVVVSIVDDAVVGAGR